MVAQILTFPTVQQIMAEQAKKFCACGCGMPARTRKEIWADITAMSMTDPKFDDMRNDLYEELRWARD